MRKRERERDGQRGRMRKTDREESEGASLLICW